MDDIEPYFLSKSLATLISEYSDTIKTDNMNIRTLVSLTLFYSISSITTPSEAHAMAFLSISKTCVFSEVKAVLTRDGEPLKNVEVIRKWE